MVRKNLRSPPSELWLLPASCRLLLWLTLWPSIQRRCFFETSVDYHWTSRRMEECKYGSHILNLGTRGSWSASRPGRLTSGWPSQSVPVWTPWRRGKPLAPDWKPVAIPRELPGLHLKMEVKPTPEPLYVWNILQTMHSVKDNICIMKQVL
jgi:hypothetical protein